jgi:hypothetical protein
MLHYVYYMNYSKRIIINKFIKFIKSQRSQPITVPLMARCTRYIIMWHVVGFSPGTSVSSSNNPIPTLQWTVLYKHQGCHIMMYRVHLAISGIRTFFSRIYLFLSFNKFIFIKGCQNWFFFILKVANIRCFILIKCSHATCFLVIHSSYQYSASFGKAADLLVRVNGDFINRHSNSFH